MLNLAHRGFSGAYPENTMLAFDQAVRTPGCDGIITDYPDLVTKFRRIAEIETEYPLGMAVCGWAD